MPAHNGAAGREGKGADFRQFRGPPSSTARRCAAAQQIFINLLSNAVKFTPEGGRSASRSLAAKTADDKGRRYRHRHRGRRRADGPSRVSARSTAPSAANMKEAASGFRWPSSSSNCTAERSRSKARSGSAQSSRCSSRPSVSSPCAKSRNRELLQYSFGSEAGSLGSAFGCSDDCPALDAARRGCRGDGSSRRLHVTSVDGS